MSESAIHCPFLNLNESCCSEHFKLDHLPYAFKYCFGAYKTCPAYAQLLAQRRVGRSNAAAAGDSRNGLDSIILQHQIPPGIDANHGRLARSAGAALAFSL